MILILIIAAGCSIFYIYEDRAISGEDVPNHLLFSVECYHLLSDMFARNDVSLIKKVFFVPVAVFHPINHAARTYTNFVSVTTSPYYLIFGKSISSARLSNLTYLLILGISVFLLGKRMGSGETGLTAMFITPMHPMIYESFRQYGLDLPLTALVALSILFMIRSEGFSSRKYSLLCGMSFAAGFLVKPQFIIFMIPAAIAAALPSPQDPDTGTKNKRINIAIIFICLLPAYMLWPGKNIFASFLYDLNKLIEFRYISGYFKNFFFFFLGIPLSLLLLPSLYRFPASGTRDRRIYMAWFGIPIVLFCIIYISLWFFPRFLMPLVPAAAIIIAVFLGRINRAAARNSAKLLLAGFLAAQFISNTYLGQDAKKIDYITSYHKRVKDIPVKIFFSSSYAASRHKKDIYRIYDMFSCIQKNRTGPTTVLTVKLNQGDPRPFELRCRAKFIGRDIDILNSWTMAATAVLKMDNADFIVFEVPDTAKFAAWLRKDFIWPEYYDTLSLLMQSTNSFTMMQARTNPDPIRKSTRKLYQVIDKYELICEIPTMQHMHWLVYKKKL